MFTRVLGRSGIVVSALGFGCWPIGGQIVEHGKSVGWGHVDDGESIRALRRAVELGVTFFDTAEVYGRSEDLLGRAFRGQRHRLVLATKFGRAYNRERHEIGADDCRPESMRRSLEGSLRRLGTDYVDLYQLHAGTCPAEQAVALREALEQAAAEGKIRAYAWSTDRVENARIFAEGAHCAAIQMHLNIFEGSTELLAFCEANNLASINRGPLAMGLLTGKYTLDSVLHADDVRGAGHDWMQAFQGGAPNTDQLAKLAAIREILASHGRTVAQGALAWLWARSPNTIPIPGFKNTRQAEENARALEFGPLTPAQMEQIERILARQPAEEAAT
jgi:aryl-alcohol dehydrogenase-like predicted oxidoreductase